MKLSHVLAACAALALAACGQSEAPAPEAPPEPQSLLEQLRALPAEQQPVFAYQQLAAYQQANPEAQPTCTAVRATESRGVIPENIDPESAYAPYVGDLVFSVQCGALISATRYDPNEHWLVVFQEGATAPTVVHCAGPRNSDVCPRQLPLVTAAP